MPSSWSSRFLPTGNSNAASSSNTPTRNPPSRLNSRDKPLPRPPSAAFEEPTLVGRDGERSLPPIPQAQQASPSRPRTHEGRHTHRRSVSHPLPKIFGKKKSAGQLGTSYHDIDVPLDDDLVPVLDESGTATPTRVISGKKGVKAGDDGDKATTKCMCCDAWVKVPRDLDKFRCMSCYTINDLKSVGDQKSDREEREKRAGSKRGETFPGGMPPGLKTLPLSLERTRAIIDRCVMTYLEVRCRREEHAGGKKPESPAQTPEEKENPMNSIPIRSRQVPQVTKQFMDVPVSSSPPDTPEPGETTVTASANIRDFTDFDLFAYHRTDTPPPADAQVVPHGPSPPTSVPRKPVPTQPNRKPPPPPLSAINRAASQRPPSQNAELSPKPHLSPKPTPHEIEQRRRYDRVKTIFRPLEDYVAASFGDYRCLNASFSTFKPVHTGRARSESNIATPPPEPIGDSNPSPIDLSQLDAKTLLLGDIGENSTWWTGRLDRNQSDKATKRKKVGGESQKRPVSSKSPNINWIELDSWYALVHTAGEEWQSKVPRLKSDTPGFSKEKLEGFTNVEEIDDDLAEGREHAIRAVLKVTENILKRPSRQLKEPEHIRFLLILLANPSLYPARRASRRPVSRTTSNPQGSFSGKQNIHPPPNLSPRKSPGRESSQHTGVLKRIFGLLANSPDPCHRYLIGWFARLDEEHLVRIIDLVGSFVTYRITRQHGRPHSKSMIADGGLIPDLSGSAMNTSQQLHAAMGLSGSVKKRADDPDQEPEYAADWQIKAAAKLMSLLFAANNVWQGKRRGNSSDRGFPSGSAAPASAARARRSGQLLHTSSFYNTLLDYMDVIADFKVWESKRDKFAFCQYPLFLSMGNKIKVLEYDARRQMEIRAREAYFDSVIRQRAQDGYFHLRVRRDCMVDDSLRQISEAVGAGQEELKKGLRVHFSGEEGVDAGGPRKEWFLMIVRDIFDPNHGMFVYDDESQTCYFNPNSFETSDQYHLVGALLGLAIYNSTILDVALPPFAFRKLLAAAPAAGAGNANISSLTGTKGQMTYTLSDLAEFRPSLATGLQQLLDFDGDVEDTYAWDFVAPMERYGAVTNFPLIPNGEATPVTNANRQAFVDAYVRHLLDTAVARQFEPFKRGFFHVCAGNALSLFRAEEIELLIRGSDEALAVDQLKAVAVYENWKHPRPPHPAVQHPGDDVPVIQWFWQLFAQATPTMQRKLLTFITGTDRIPAVGATSLILRIVAGGDGWGGGGEQERERFPVARTCFNMLVLWRYDCREQLAEKLWRAVEESEGFGLK